MNVNVTAALIAAVPATIAAVGTWRNSWQVRRVGKRVAHVDRNVTEHREVAIRKLDHIAEQTNGRLAEQIREAIAEYSVNNPNIPYPVVMEAIRELLDTIILNVWDYEEEGPEHGERR